MNEFAAAVSVTDPDETPAPLSYPSAVLPEGLGVLFLEVLGFLTAAAGGVCVSGRDRDNTPSLSLMCYSAVCPHCAG